MPRSSIKDEKAYPGSTQGWCVEGEGSADRELSRQTGGRSSTGRKGGKSSSYEDWTVDELKKKAKEVGLSGYSSQRKGELIDALRNH